MALNVAIGGYAARTEDVRLGDLHLEMLTVDHLENLVDAGALLREDNVPEPPYWAHLWTGSRVLAELVASEIDCRGRRVIDIGCGLGLAGIAAARRGGRVLLADYVFDAMRFAQANVRLNHCDAAVAVIDLCRPALSGKFDLCLAADITYDPKLQVALAEFLAQHLSENGEAWCVESVRTTDRGFDRACQALGLQTVETERSAIDEGRRIAVRATRVTRPA